MKAKIDLEKFVRSLMERYYEKIHIDPTTTKCWLDSVLEYQGLEYKDGEIVEIAHEPEFKLEIGKWYKCILTPVVHKHFTVGKVYECELEGCLTDDTDEDRIVDLDLECFRPATDDEIPHEPPSKPDYENLSIINEGDDGVLLYFTKDGRGISDFFRISKDTARWLHGRLGEYLEMYDDEQPKEQEEREDLRKKYERIGKSDWFKKTHAGISIGEQPLEEDVVGMGGLGKVWNEEAIISRLDKIIELLSWKPSPNIIPYPYTQPITYDTNQIYCDTANKGGGEE